jgi:hypothetical protein
MGTITQLPVETVNLEELPAAGLLTGSDQLLITQFGVATKVGLFSLKEEIFPAETATAITANTNTTIANAEATNLDAIATAADRVQTGLDVIATAAATNADAIATAADVVTTNADVLLAEGYKDTTNTNVTITNADVVITNADVLLTNADAASTNADALATAADSTQTGLDATTTNNNVTATNADAIATAADRVQTGLDVLATNADVVITNADALATGLDSTQTGLDATATGLDVITTNADVVITNADALATAADVITTNNNVIATAEATNEDAIATAADRVQTGLDVVATNADVVATNANVVIASDWAIAANASRLATNADVLITNADVLTTNADVVITNADATATSLSETNAAGSEAATQILYDDFQSQYLGVFTTDPTLDNLGQALAEGAIYFNSTNTILRVYVSSAWQDTGTTTSLTKFKYLATAGQTVFTGPDDIGNTFSVTVGLELVFLNGINLEPPSGYSSTTSALTLDTAAALNDEIVVYSFGTATIADTVSATNGGVFQSSISVNAPLTATSFIETYNVVAAADVDLAIGSFFRKTLSADITFTASGIPASGKVGSFILELINGGDFAVTWLAGTTWELAGPPTLTAGGLDILGFYTSDGGTTWRGIVLAQGMA